MLENKTFNLIYSSLPFLLKGLIITVKIAIFASLIGLLFGFLFGVFSSKKLKIKGISSIINFYVLVIHGTPVYVLEQHATEGFLRRKKLMKEDLPEGMSEEEYKAKRIADATNEVKIDPGIPREPNAIDEVPEVDEEHEAEVVAQNEVQREIEETEIEEEVDHEAEEAIQAEIEIEIDETENNETETPAEEETQEETETTE